MSRQSELASFFLDLGGVTSRSGVNRELKEDFVNRVFVRKSSKDKASAYGLQRRKESKTRILL